MTPGTLSVVNEHQKWELRSRWRSKSICPSVSFYFRNWPSPFKRKNIKTGTRTSKPNPQNPESKQGCDTAPVYDDVSEFPVYATVNKPKYAKRDDGNVHYADIQVFSKIRERSAEEVKSLQSQNATEYATLNFPRPGPKYDSKNGTLV
ncbi:PREDICTED: uncharacterized protein C11orf52 homolog [Gekko japonicus]|uniref:Uncharacterized protein C11orf52 homolog n=1 Tax=Gekko japonicus TaxID=146911 RepID=A0ABM1KIG5_GEKJA|nr:PREDICTED: uncharacterized protein C11orf52 homolog [Gekko japonicus]